MVASREVVSLLGHLEGMGFAGSVTVLAIKVSLAGTNVYEYVARCYLKVRRTYRMTTTNWSLMGALS